MPESPAERMHNRILSGAAYSTQDVTADEFEAVALSAGTSQLPEIKHALFRLRMLESPKKKV